MGSGGGGGARGWSVFRLEMQARSRQRACLCFVSAGNLRPKFSAPAPTREVTRSRPSKQHVKCVARMHQDLHYEPLNDSPPSAHRYLCASTSSHLTLPAACTLANLSVPLAGAIRLPPPPPQLSPTLHLLSTYSPPTLHLLPPPTSPSYSPLLLPPPTPPPTGPLRSLPTPAHPPFYPSSHHHHLLLPPPSSLFGAI